MLLSFIVKVVLYLPCEKNENKQKEAVGFGPFKNIVNFRKIVKQQCCCFGYSLFAVELVCVASKKSGISFV